MNKENVTETLTSSKSPKENSSKNKKTKIIIGSLIVVICVLIVVLAVNLFKKEPEEQAKDGRVTFVSKKNIDEVQEALNQPIEDAAYTTSMTVDWEFYDGTSASTTAYVKNSTANKRTVYYDVHLQSGELVYSSPYLPVGEEMDQIILDKVLNAGEYPAVVTYHLVDDEHQEITTVAVAITIRVLN